MCCKQHRPDPARGGQPQAHRRAVQRRGQRHAVHRHHPHPGPLRAAGAGGQTARGLPQGQRQPAPGLARPGGAHAAGRGGRDRHRHRIAVQLPRPGHPALLRMAARAGAAATTRWPRKGAHDAGRPGRRAADHLPPHVHRAHAHRPAFAQRSSSRASRWRRSTPTSSRPMCAWAWAWASWPRWRCATTAARRPGGAPAGPPVRPERARVAFKRGAYLRNFRLPLPSC
jgi:hypothetical protein